MHLAAEVFGVVSRQVDKVALPRHSKDGLEIDAVTQMRLWMTGKVAGEVLIGRVEWLRRSIVAGCTKGLSELHDTVSVSLYRSLASQVPNAPFE